MAMIDHIIYEGQHNAQKSNAAVSNDSTHNTYYHGSFESCKRGYVHAMPNLFSGEA